MPRSSKPHVIDAYLSMKARYEQGKATPQDLERSEVSLIVWATLVVQRDANKEVASLQAKQVFNQLSSNEQMERILGDPKLKQEFLALLVA